MLKLKKYLINKRMDKLLLLMKEEKDIVDGSFGDWDKVNLYLFKAKSTMKALRRLNNKLKDLG
jgi:hypothetical protein